MSQPAVFFNYDVSDFELFYNTNKSSAEDLNCGRHLLVLAVNSIIIVYTYHFIVFYFKG